MTSITHMTRTAQLDYKPIFAEMETHEPTSGDGYKRTIEYREWRNRAAAALFEAGFEIEATAFLHCAELPFFFVAPDIENLPEHASTVWICDHDQSHDAVLYFCTCDNRGCPDCAARQVARFAKRYVDIILNCAGKHGRDRLRHIVLTTPLALSDPDAPTKTSQYANAVADMWKLLEKRDARWTTEGTLEAFEFGTDGHKLHFHIIHYGAYLPQKAIVAAWRDLTGGECEISYVRAIGLDTDGDDQGVSSEVMETLKYSVKFWSKDENGHTQYIDPELIPDLVNILKGKRRVRSRGIFYNIPGAVKEPLCCETCGNQLLRIGVAFFPIWQETGFTPQEYREMVEGFSLNLILANKSEKSGEVANKSPPVQRSLWAEKDGSPHRGYAHYDEPRNRKPF